MESSTLFPKIHMNHMLPSRCIHEPCRNMDVTTWESWRPGSVAHTTPPPIGKPVPGAARSVSSPGMSPRLQTEAAKPVTSPDWATWVAPAPCTSSQAAMLRPMMTKVTTGVRTVSFSSRYGNTCPT